MHRERERELKGRTLHIDGKNEHYICSVEVAVSGITSLAVEVNRIGDDDEQVYALTFFLGRLRKES